MKRLFGLGKNPKTFEFKCPDCGNIHRGSPSFAYAKPTYYFDVPEEERDSRITLSEDLCTIAPSANDDGGDDIYCIRATLDIPIMGAAEPFCWGVWVTQSKENFDRYVDTYSQDQSNDGSFGWLAVTMAYYNRVATGEPLEHLECDVEWGTARQRPKLILQHSEHPLSVDQHEGIKWDKAIEIARTIMHA